MYRGETSGFATPRTGGTVQHTQWAPFLLLLKESNGVVVVPVQSQSCVGDF